MFPEEIAVPPLEALAAVFRILKAVVLASAATVIWVFEEVLAALVPSPLYWPQML